MHMTVIRSPPSGRAATAKATPQAGAMRSAAHFVRPACRFEVAVGGSMYEFGVLSGVAEAAASADRVSCREDLRARPMCPNLTNGGRTPTVGPVKLFIKPDGQS